MSIEETPAAMVIFAITIIISMLAIYKSPGLIYRMILVPYKVYHQKRFELMVTSGLIHADLMHLMFNMFSFYFFGFRLEQAIGSLNFIILYFATMVLANISTVLKHRNDEGYASLGASGAISGVVFASVMIDPNSTIMVMPIPIPLPAYIYAVLFLVWSYFAAKKSQDMINHDAHFWGALAGVTIMVLLYPGIISAFFSQIL